MKQAKFAESYKMLQDFLCLPPNSEIVFVESGKLPHTFDVHVFCAGFFDRDKVVRIEPVFKKQPTTILEDWGFMQEVLGEGEE